jgi:hypothetical protein
MCGSRRISFSMKICLTCFFERLFPQLQNLADCCRLLNVFIYLDFSEWDVTTWVNILWLKWWSLRLSRNRVYCLERTY